MPKTNTRTEEGFAQVLDGLCGCGRGTAKRLIVETIEDLNAGQVISYDRFRDTITGDAEAIEAVWANLKTAKETRPKARRRRAA